MKNIDLILLNLIYYLIKLKEIQGFKTIKKCGIVTQIGLTTSTGGLFFPATNVNTNNSFEYAFTTKFNEITANDNTRL